MSKQSHTNNIDHRFALVDSAGRERYPYKKSKRDGRFGFVLGRDRGPDVEVVQTLEEVIKAVVFDKKETRVTTDPPVEGLTGNGLSLYGHAIRGYRIDPSLEHLVRGARVQPLGPVAGPTASSGSPIPPLQYDLTALEQLQLLTAEHYLAALEQVDPAMTPAQREMLRGHANTEHQELAMRSIALLGGYDRPDTAHLQYGRLGRMFAEALGVDCEELENKVQAICVSAERQDEAGHFVWRLRPQVVNALRMAGWIEPEEEVSQEPRTAEEAEAELDNDDKCRDISETTRKALVNARIGQGGYRLRMLKLWNGCCAVTGLNIKTALVASHAKAWKDSENDERLDEHNGLLLSATLDRLFDSGLISFSDTGDMLVKDLVSLDAKLAAGIKDGMKLRMVPERCRKYLRAHRERFNFSI